MTNPLVKLNFFQRLTQLLMSRTFLRSLPENLLRENRELRMFSIYNSPLISDIPPQFFSHCPLLYYLRLSGNSLNIWRAQWFASAPLLQTLIIYSNQIAEVPRKALIHSSNLQTLLMQSNRISTIDSNSFGDVGNVATLQIGQSVTAIDHGLIDRMTSLSRFIATNNPCVNQDFVNFQSNKASNMLILEPCFETFDARNISEMIFNNFNV